MLDLARQIRRQLADSDRKTFRKTRQSLLEIAVVLEAAHKALVDTKAAIPVPDAPKGGE